MTYNTCVYVSNIRHIMHGKCYLYWLGDLELPGGHHLEGSHAPDGVDHPVHLRGLQGVGVVDVLLPPLVASLWAVVVAEALLEEPPQPR